MKKSVESSLEELVCPICQELPIKPVHAGDGKVYERNEIERWIKTLKDEGKEVTSPSTRSKMNDTLLDAPHIYNIIEKLIIQNNNESNNIHSCDLAKSWLERVQKLDEDKNFVSKLFARAETGDGEAMYNLASCYIKGEKGLEVDILQGSKWFKESSDHFYPPGMMAYGNMLVFGCGHHVEKNVGLGCMLMGSAASEGSDAACYHLGNWYLNEKFGFPKDIQKTKYYWLKVVDGSSCTYPTMQEAKSQIEKVKKWLSEN